MRKFDILILIVLMLLSAVNSFASVLSDATPEEKAQFEDCIINRNTGCPPPDVIYQPLLREVADDLEREAFILSLSRDAYVSTDTPFTKLLSVLQSNELKNMDRIDFRISVVKLGMRYYFLKNARVKAPNFTQNEEIYQRLMQDISGLHHFPL